MGSTVSMIYFACRRRWWSLGFITAPLLLVTTLHGEFLDAFPSTFYDKLTATVSSVATCGILNVLFLVALRVFSIKDGSAASND